MDTGKRDPLQTPRAGDVVRTAKGNVLVVERVDPDGDVFMFLPDRSSGRSVVTTIAEWRTNCVSVEILMVADA